ncbi:hypothetical protein SH139x_002184 [Planctomycetaceae bacterium SH139]
MARRLSIQSLEDRRLLAAQPVLVDVSTLVGTQAESRLVQSDVPAIILSRDGIDPVAVSESMLGVLPEAAFRAEAFRAEALPSITSEVTQRLNSLRPMIQGALVSPASSDARHAFLELTDELVDQVIGRIDAGEVFDEPTTTNAEVSPEIAEAIRSLVLDRLVAIQSTIESRLQSQASVEFQGMISDWRPVQTESIVDESPHQLTRSSDTGETTPLDSSTTIGTDIPDVEINHVSHAPDPAKVIPLQLLAPSVSTSSQTPFVEDARNTLRGALDAFFFYESRVEDGSPTTRLALFKLGDLVGGVSSLDLLSALDATTSDLVETVDEVRPRIDVRLAAFISALTMGYVLRIRNRGSKEQEEFDEEGETLKIEGRVPRPNFGV